MEKNGDSGMAKKFWDEKILEKIPG